MSTYYSGVYFVGVDGYQWLGLYEILGGRVPPPVPPVFTPIPYGLRHRRHGIGRIVSKMPCALPSESNKVNYTATKH